MESQRNLPDSPFELTYDAALEYWMLKQSPTQQYPVDLGNGFPYQQSGPHQSVEQGSVTQYPQTYSEGPSVQRPPVSSSGPEKLFSEILTQLCEIRQELSSIKASSAGMSDGISMLQKSYGPSQPWYLVHSDLANIERRPLLRRRGSISHTTRPGR